MTFKTEPYAHQLALFDEYKDREYFGLFNDMGTGKTKVIIDIAAYKLESQQIEAMLVIAPNHVHAQWIREELPKHCPCRFRSMEWSSYRGKQKYWTDQLRDHIDEKTPGLLRVFAVNVEAFQADSIIPWVAAFVQRNKCFIVVDEATRIGNARAKRSKVIHKLNKYGYRAILTGTPTAKSPFKLWSMMEFLKANYFDCNEFIFAHRYGVMMKGLNEQTGKKFNTLINEEKWGKTKSSIERWKTAKGELPLAEEDYEAISELCELSVKNIKFIAESEQFARFKNLAGLKNIIAKDTSSIKKEDCLDLPPKVYGQRYVSMSKEQHKVYNDLKTELLAEYAGTELSVTNKIALATRLRQVTGGFFPFVDAEERFSPERGEWYTKLKAGALPIGDKNPKVEALLEELEEIGEGEPVIVWATFTAELRAIHAAVVKAGYKACLYYGATSDRDRELIKLEFMAGKYDIFVGNTATAGYGLNLQRATNQIFFSNNFDTEGRLQAEDRSHRIGVKGTCLYKDLIVKGTIDERVAEVVKEGKDLNDFFRTADLKTLLGGDEQDDFAF
jgi:SNF2 family DNA or RNA helicase